MNNKRKILIAVLGLVSIVLIGAGASLAFFSFTQTGTTENTIKAGTIEFHYDEINKKGAGISLVDALPVDNNYAEMRKNNYFEFNVTAKTANQPISYVVTAKKSDDSDDLDEIVDMYLTDGNDTTLFFETGGSIYRYSNLVQYRKKAATEKVIYTGTVPAGSENYNQEFRLRMWIDQKVDFSGKNVTKYFCSGTEVEYNSAEYTACDQANLTQTTDMEYKYNGKTFKITVNVYTDTDITDYAPAAIVKDTTNVTLSSLSVEGCTFDQPFDPSITEYTCVNYSGIDRPKYSAVPANENIVIGYSEATEGMGDMVYPVPGEPYMYYSTITIPLVTVDGTKFNNYVVHTNKYMDGKATQLATLEVDGCPVGFKEYSYNRNYTCTASKDITISDFTYTTKDSNATATIALASQENIPGGTLSKYEITVTAYDGVTVGDKYKIDVTRITDPTKDATLSSLSVTGCPFKFNETFKPEVTNYHCARENTSEPFDISNIVYTTTVDGATTEVDTLTSSPATSDTYRVKVTATDGETWKFYYIFVDK